MALIPPSSNLIVLSLRSLFEQASQLNARIPGPDQPWLPFGADFFPPPSQQWQDVAAADFLRQPIDIEKFREELNEALGPLPASTDLSLFTFA